MEKVKIIVDNRERNANLLESLTSENVELSFAQLPVGDYVLSDRICIERKTTRDFENSIINSRLFDQINRLSISCPKPVLIIEGDESEFTLNPNVITGTLAAIYADYNIQVIRSHDTSETASILEKIAKREQNDEKRNPVIVGRKRAYSVSEWQMLSLSAMPGVGPKLARLLLNHFHTLNGISNASVKDLKNVNKS